MNKVMAALVLLLFLLSCKSNTHIIQFNAIDKNFRSYSLLIQQENDRIYQDMQDKLHDPQTRNKAQIWQPKAEKIKELSTTMYGFIDSLKNELKKDAGLTINHGKEGYDKADGKPVKHLFAEEGMTNDLSHKLIDFKQTVIALIKPEEFADNPRLQKDLISYSNELRTTILTDVQTSTLKNNKEITAANTNLISTYFQNTSALEAITLLDKIQNDILYAENKLLNYFNGMAVSYRDLVYEQYSAIITQSRSYLNQGQTLQIYAGMGTFNQDSRPTFTFNGVAVPIGPDGMAIYQLEINNKPGKYSIPVKIEFTKADGSPSSMTKKITYTVAK